MTTTPAMRFANGTDRLHAQYVRRDGDTPRLIEPTEPFAVPVAFVKGCGTYVTLGENISGATYAIAAVRLIIGALNRFHRAASNTTDQLFVRNGSPFRWLHGNEDWAKRNGLQWVDMNGWTSNVEDGYIHNALDHGGVGHLVTASGRLVFCWSATHSHSGYSVVGGYFVLFADPALLAELGIADSLATIVGEAEEAHRQALEKERRSA